MWDLNILIASLVALVTILVQLHIFNTKRRDQRIDDFITAFFNDYPGAGNILRLLMPSGINNLKNDKEIKIALGKLKNRLNVHPLRNWNDEIKTIGYKRFFNFFPQLNTTLTNKSIDIAINTLKKS